MKNYVESGKSISITTAGAKTSGEPIVIGALVGIPAATVAANVNVVCMLEGVYTLPKTTGTAWALGQKLYWDATNKKCTTVAGADDVNLPMGHAVEAAASADTSGTVRLSN